MASSRSSTWKVLLIAAGVLFVIGLLTAGFIVPVIAIVLLILVLGGGALLYRTQGPPEA